MTLSGNSTKMGVYEVLIKRDAEKDLLSLPKSDLKRVAKKIRQLGGNPRPFGCEKLKGEEGFRVRQGNYRVIYLVNDGEKMVRIIKVGNRKEVYR